VRHESNFRKKRDHARLLVTLFAASLWLTAAQGAEPAVDPKDLPRTPPTEPANALTTFQVKPGFHLEIAAAEPIVVDPVAMSFDENGRLFVVEMRDYSERRDERLGRIRLLVDSDGDGRFDKSTIFAEGLAWPTAIICYDGGVFVGATPDIWYFKDTNGDGVADQKTLVFTGFAEPRPGSAQRAERLNVQGLFNSFNWTLDNRIHGSSGTMGGFVHQPNSTNGIDVRGKDFSFDPRNLSDLRTETGGGQHGLTFDDLGRKFVCQNSAHIREVMYEDRYANRNPYYTMPPATIDIPVDGPAAEVYRISPEEPWRVIRTAWRVSGKVPGLIEGGGRASGYFTGASGVTIYRGNAFPGEFTGDAFIADVGSNLIHRKKLHPNGIALLAKRPPDEEKVEFIASRDLWFRPVQFANAPDGTLYFADMYREVIEHPWSIPESIKKHLDLNSGNDRGRIYRIVPDGFRQPALPQLSRASTSELVETLAHRNGWHRDTAARLLYERQDKAAIPQLVGLVRNSPSAMARMHSLYALDGIHALAPAQLIGALNDSDEIVRAHAVRLLERTKMEWSEPQLNSAIAHLARDPSILVIYQLALSLGEFPATNRVDLLARIAGNHSADPWIRAALLSSLRTGAGEFWTRLRSSEASMNAELFSGVLKILGEQHEPHELEQVLQALNKEANEAQAFSWAAALASGLQKSGAFDRRAFEALFSRALESVALPSRAEAERNAAAELVGDATFAQAGAALFNLLQPSEPASLQRTALHSLRQFTYQSIATRLIALWRGFTPQLRSEALDLMIARAASAQQLLAAMQSGQITAAELNASQKRALLQHPTATVRTLATTLLTPAEAPSRLFAEYRPALDVTGVATRGRELYVQRCASCHRAGKEGNHVGPDFASVVNSGKEKLLLNIVDPNKEVPPQYLAYTAETKTGEAITGIISSESGASISLLEATGRTNTLLRSEINHLQSQGQSLMPEGLLSGLSHQQVADLLAFIVQTR